MSIGLFVADWFRRLNPFVGNAVPLVATYTREIPVSIARMYENAIDGEHLPWLHKSTFAELEIIDSGDWGWRGAGYLQPRSFTTWMELELQLDREKNRWITTTLRGLGKGNQIITHAIPLAENRIKVIVDFYVPRLPRLLHRIYGAQLVETYKALYDEDQWMMETRQRALDKRSGSAAQTESIELGSWTDVQRKLPLVFSFQDNSFRLLQLDGKLLAHATTCPHMLGPLQEAEVVNGEVECPWHGYRFAIGSGECTSGKPCRLAAAPEISIDASRGVVIASGRPRQQHD